MGTSNFFYKNRCVAISDADFEDGNLPECENDYYGRNKMLLQKVLMFDITINIGYYSGACIDYQINDSYDNIINDFYGYYYEPSTKKELINDIYHYYKDTIEISKRSMQKLLKGLSLKKEIINDICYYCKDTINVSKKSLQSELKGLSLKKDYEAIIDKIEDYILPKIECKVNTIINDIKREYGYIELTRIATFSNGEAIYRQIG